MQVLRPTGITNTERLTPDTLERLLDYSETLIKVIGGLFQGPDGWIVSAGSLGVAYSTGTLTLSQADPDIPIMLILNDGTFVKLEESDFPLTVADLASDDDVYLHLEAQVSPETIDVPVLDIANQKEIIENRTKGIVLTPVLNKTAPTDNSPGVKIGYIDSNNTFEFGDNVIDQEKYAYMLPPIVPNSLASIIRKLNNAIPHLVSGLDNVPTGTSNTFSATRSIKVAETMNWGTNFVTEYYDYTIAQALQAVSDMGQSLPALTDRVKELDFLSAVTRMVTVAIMKDIKTQLRPTNDTWTGDGFVVGPDYILETNNDSYYYTTNEENYLSSLFNYLFITGNGVQTQINGSINDDGHFLLSLKIFQESETNRITGFLHFAPFFKVKVTNTDNYMYYVVDREVEISHDLTDESAKIDFTFYILKTSTDNQTVINLDGTNVDEIQIDFTYQLFIFMESNKMKEIVDKMQE